MKKQGFTLIELMVVIVIMGILAAVAVPKLFGMIAKSKASELGTAAGSYVKLQDAFVAEAGAMGGWKKIGYAINGSSNFSYNGGALGEDATTNVDALGETGVKGWEADNNAKLNDCAMHSKWSLTVKVAGSAAQGMVEYTPAISGSGCSDLTPNFTKIGGNAT